MTDFIIVSVVLLLIGAAMVYIVKEKKRGVKCIGCPNGGCSHNNEGLGGCGGNCSGSCSGCHSEKK